MNSDYINSGILNNQEVDDKELMEKSRGNKSMKERYEDSMNTISKTSTNLKESVFKNIQKKTEETSERINDTLHKNSRIHNLEKMLYLDKTSLLKSDKDISIYRPTPKKIIIFENDRMGDVETITTKEDSTITIQVVKYTKQKPFIYPNFSDVKIPGEPYYMDENEIWYRSDNILTICYKDKNVMTFNTINLLEIKNLAEENIITFVKQYNTIHRSSKLAQFIDKNTIDINKIVRITNKYIILEDEDANYEVYLYDQKQNDFKKLVLTKLPDIQLSSLDAILTVEMTEFLEENNYPIEKFEEYDGFIEYNKVIGNRKICMFRIKV